jgi:zinc protease
MTLAIVGDIDPDAVVARSRALFGETAEPDEQATMRPIPVDPRPTAPRTVTRRQNKQQAHIVYGFSGTTVSHPDRFPLEVLSTILSGQGGRLFVELRDRRGLAYRVSAFSVEGVDPGYFAVYIATSPGNIDLALSGITEQLDRVMNDAIPKSELERAKRYLVGAHEISLQRRAALASTLAFHECYGLGWDEHRRYAPAILQVTAADVQKVARKYLDPRYAITAMVTPDEAAGAHPAALRAARVARRR